MPGPYFGNSGCPCRGARKRVRPRHDAVLQAHVVFPKHCLNPTARTAAVGGMTEARHLGSARPKNLECRQALGDRSVFEQYCNGVKARSVVSSQHLERRNLGSAEFTLRQYVRNPVHQEVLTPTAFVRTVAMRTASLS